MQAVHPESRSSLLTASAVRSDVHTSEALGAHTAATQFPLSQPASLQARQQSDVTAYAQLELEHRMLLLTAGAAPVALTYLEHAAPSTPSWELPPPPVVPPVDAETVHPAEVSRHVPAEQAPVVESQLEQPDVTTLDAQQFFEKMPWQLFDAHCQCSVNIRQHGAGEKRHTTSIAA
jgi:hypothetical protein